MHCPPFKRDRTDAEATTLPQPAGGVTGVIGEDQIGTGAPEAEQGLEHDGPFIDPAPLGGGLHHRVLAADVVSGDRQFGLAAEAVDDVEIG